MEIGNALSAMFKREAIDLAVALKFLDAYAVIPVRFADVPLKQAVSLDNGLLESARVAIVREGRERSRR